MSPNGVGDITPVMSSSRHLEEFSSLIRQMFAIIVEFCPEVSVKQHRSERSHRRLGRRIRFRHRTSDKGEPGKVAERPRQEHVDPREKRLDALRA
jgi:hypothetical protein